MIDKLKDLDTSEQERVGFVLASGEVVEVQNVAEDPKVSFSVSTEDLLKYEDEAIAAWHTHPKGGVNLSAEDYEAFMMWPDWDHYIIGSGQVAKYKVEDGVVVKA